MRKLVIGMGCVLLAAQAAGKAQDGMVSIEVPARTGYCEPDALAMRRAKDGSVTSWAGTLSWYGWIENVGKLMVVVRLAPGGEAAGESGGEAGEMRLAVSSQPRSKSQVRSARFSKGETDLRFGPYEIAKKGYHRFALSMVEDKGGQSLALRAPGLRALVLQGPAALGAHFSLVERRNAASVHLRYPIPKAAQGKVEWFYCELTPKTDPLWTYYEATGWHRGYFGMQVNSKKERRIIFSVWDAGKEAVSRSKVAKADRVTLLAKGEGVHASGFGNEGTGGHSHLAYNWKLGDTLRFLMHAQVDGSHTIYTGWCYFPKRKAWGLIASFRAPHDGKTPRGLYSFNEDFGGANGQLRRVCEFHNQWVRTTDGQWLPLLEAHFSYDGHGRKQRLDRSAGVLGDRFYLANGGFVGDSTPGSTTKARTVLKRRLGQQVHPEDADLPSRTSGSGQDPVAPEPIVFQPVATSLTNVVINNPGKGWLLFAGGADSGPHPSLGADILELGSTGYTRFNWKRIQPFKGKFDWSPIDKAILAWKRVGKRFAFRIMAANTHAGEGENGAYVTPKWVFEAGARSQSFVVDPASPWDGMAGRKVIPVWTDPIFKEYVQKLVRALAKRYDGHPDIAFIGIGTYGNWGEQHNWPYRGVNLSDTELIEHMTWYSKAFKKTQIIVPWGRKVLDPAYDWAVAQGMGIRRDGLLGASPRGEECARAYGKTPAVFEWHGPYRALVQNKRWSTKAFWTSLRTGRPSYQGTYWGTDAKHMYAKEAPLMREAANRLGYHFVLEEARYPLTMGNGRRDKISLRWRNDGLTPIYFSARVKLALLDAHNRVLATTLLETIDPTSWMPYDKTKQAKVDVTEFEFSHHRRATRLAIGLFSHPDRSEPDIKLGIEGRLENGWYALSAR